jgi:hypothetical protein
MAPVLIFVSIFPVNFPYLQYYTCPPQCCLSRVPKEYWTFFLEVTVNGVYGTTLISGIRAAVLGNPLTLFLTHPALRRPRDREPLFLGSCSQMPVNLGRFVRHMPPPPTYAWNFLADQTHQLVLRKQCFWSCWA